MALSRLKPVVFGIVCYVLFFCFLPRALAARTIDSATLNGSASVNVAPSTSVTASVTVTTSGAGATHNWNSTSYEVSGQGVNCVDHTNHTTTSTFTENFSITAPGTEGSYDVSFIAHQNNTCSQNPSPTLTLTGGIVVATPTGPTTSTPPPGPPAVTYYPSVSLTPYSPNPTNRRSLTFSGDATVEQGAIAAVEYTITEGAQWLNASGTFDSSSESFSFTTPEFSEGKYTITVRARSAAGVMTPPDAYKTNAVTIITTPPTITLDPMKSTTTKNTQPAITGSAASKLGRITKVDVSLDGGTTYKPAKLAGRRFTFIPETLEDGNYTVIARAYDNASNVGRSDTRTVIIDTMPPVIGGGMHTLGPQQLSPDKNNTVTLAAGTDTTIGIQMKGGVTQALIRSDAHTFPLTKLPHTDLWTGVIRFDEQGQKPLSVEAMDGAANKTVRPFHVVQVKDFGKITDKRSDQPVNGARLTVYYFEPTSQQWAIWEAGAYGQDNPQQTRDNGRYSLMVPPGKYYIDINAPGYKTAQTEIMEVVKPSIIYDAFALTPLPGWRMRLPIMGEVAVHLPQLSPPAILKITSLTPEVVQADAPVTTPTAALIASLEFLNLEGKPVSVDSYAGKKLIITFIAPWSPLAQEQASLLSQITGELTRDQALLVVLLQENASSTQAFMRRGNYTFPVVTDQNGISADVYAVTLLPYHMFIDSTGAVTGKRVGVLDAGELLTIYRSMQ